MPNALVPLPVNPRINGNQPGAAPLTFQVHGSSSLCLRTCGLSHWR